MTPEPAQPAESPEARADTVAFVQEWLANADYDPTQFDRDFAAAIDARAASTARPTERGAVEKIARIVDPLAWRNRDDYVRTMEAQGGCAPETIADVAHQHVRHSLRTAHDVLEALATQPATGRTMGGEVPLPKGMKAWAGGLSAPDDWDGGPVYLDWGHGKYETFDDPEFLTWTHVGGAGNDHAYIIGYTPRAALQNGGE